MLNMNILRSCFGTFLKSLAWRMRLKKRWECCIITTAWVRSSAGERFLHTEEVAGSIPAAPTRAGNKPAFIIQNLDEREVYP